ncbi:ribosomal RNA small subunit methyltransferase G [Bartonella bacilliformis Peru38]|uniref:Ribosomal RNA small subunit methyltransferase G n=2 Tax=Bartonella bacilliformis TaxID=774 RepID=RSMG_BARBK|nr:16S rRNA (guanine(527)-N(7))-methyltransferase RsmG [Bartonella bacilliformis]A1UQU8.1 RecName: Full=Ribosomal RNA small subunit methyltransferase G; AltName: Full=16S rRNA 7-methylguanosine methyltransferase; Short=16S rRNA m7G methyltransferase [Bartonella bacilliformis KC583]ABM45326.1 methyltransferase GidB [Bartonella bacilliformis KC583]AMG85251.1 ribosomal RNA small subunit methyltransferase G [Bartonella bacilliformis]EKS46583.1 16S rRNA methyltransferase GidB [Bartonella bacilliform
MVVLVEQKYQELLNMLPSVSRETMENLIQFESLIIQWNAHINLISAATVPFLWTRHILDSAQIYPLYSQCLHWCDLGSGGGFPAIVIAIFLKEKQKGHIDLIESNGKKVAFLRTVIAQLNLPATVYHCRIEDVYQKINAPEIITARGLASLNTLLQLTFPWLKQKTIALLQKGRDYAIEVENAYANWRFNLLKHQSKIDENSVILEISHVRSCQG